MRHFLGIKSSSLLADRRILTLLLSVLISRLGYGSYFIGLVWYLAQGGDTWKVAYLVLTLTVPGVIIGPLTGGLIDRYSRRAILVAMEFAQALGCLLLLLVLYTTSNYVALLAAASLCASFREVYVVAQRVYLADLSEKTHLLALNGFVAMAGQIGAALGALIGGLLAAKHSFAPVGMYGCLLLISCALLQPYTRWSGETIRGPKAELSAKRSFRSDIYVAFAFLREQPSVSASYILAVLSLGVLPIFNTSLPIFVVLATDGGSEEYGLIDAAFGVGGAIACLYGAKLTAYAPRHTSLIGTMALALSLYAITHAPTVALIAIASLIAGFSFFSWLGHLTDGQTSTPNNIQGRVMALFESSYAIVAVLFLLTLNSLVETVGVAAVIQCYSIVLGISAILVILSRTTSTPLAGR